MNLLLDCNAWVGAVEQYGRLPQNPDELRSTFAGKVAQAAFSGRKLNGEPISVVLSKHILETSDHVASRKFGTRPRELSGWIARNIIARLAERGASSYDPTPEDYAALTAASAAANANGAHSGAEDAEDAAVLRAAKAANAVLVTADDDLLGAARRNGVKTMHPKDLVRALAA